MWDRIQGRQDGMAGEDAADSSRGLLLLSVGPWKPCKETCRQRGLERTEAASSLVGGAESSLCRQPHWVLGGPGPGACNSCVPAMGSPGPRTPTFTLST